MRPTFRPDGVVNLLAPGWRARLDALSAAQGVETLRVALDALPRNEVGKILLRELVRLGTDG